MERIRMIEKKGRGKRSNNRKSKEKTEWKGTKKNGEVKEKNKMKKREAVKMGNAEKGRNREEGREEECAGIEKMVWKGRERRFCPEPKISPEGKVIRGKNRI